MSSNQFSTIRRVLIAFLLFISIMAVSAQDDDDVIIEPAVPTETPALPALGGIDFSNSFIPTFDLPATFDDLLEAYPELVPYLESIADTLPEDLDYDELYARLIQIYDTEGASGLAVFLNESGLLEKLGLPHSYLDLLTIYEEGGLAAVEEEARTRKIITDNNELIGYMAIDDEDNLDAVTDALEALAVNVYEFNENTNEVQIGIRIDVLAQFDTPAGLLAYLAEIGNVEHAEGIRPPVPVETTQLSLGATTGASVGAQHIGADVWHEQGITGSGVRVGVLDLGFAGVVDRVRDGSLPENMEANYGGDVLNNQSSDHGTAVAMVVHGAAPDAELFLAYYDGTYSSFISALEWLVINDVQIINHSAGSAVGPRNGYWGDAALVNAFVEETGILWINAAGNEATSHTLLQYTPGEEGVHTYGNDVYFLPFATYAPQTTIIMNWDGNWNGGETTSYYLVVVDENGDEVATAAEPRQGGQNDFPIQATVFESVPGAVYYLAIIGDGVSENILDLFIYNSELPEQVIVPEYSVIVPGDAPASLTVGATGLTNDTIEVYSSQGPTTDNRIKPDVAAPTGEQVTGYEDYGFTGTSGAAPLVAGVAALVKQAYPEATAEELKAFIMENVTDLGEAGIDPVFGTGQIALSGGDTSDDGGNDSGGLLGGGDDNSGGFELPGGSSAEPSAVILDANAQFNVKVGGRTGIQFDYSFELQNYSGTDLLIGVICSDGAGNDLPSADPEYDIEGTIGVFDTVRVWADRTVFRDVIMFIPNGAFAQTPAGTQVACVVGVFDFTDENNIVFLGSSDYLTFDIR